MIPTSELSEIPIVWEVPLTKFDRSGWIVGHSESGFRSVTFRACRGRPSQMGDVGGLSAPPTFLKFKLTDY